MAHYLSPVRRKIGVAVLLFATLFMVGWIRSTFVDDFFEFPGAPVDDDTGTFSGIATRNQSLVVYWASGFDESRSAQPVSLAVQRVGPSQENSTASLEEEDSGIQQASAEIAAEVPIEQAPLTLWFQNSQSGASSNAPRFGDEHLELLHSIDGLTRLSLSNTATTENGLKKLIGLKTLNTLILSGTETTDIGMAHIAQLEGLTVLSLSRTKITDEGIKAIRGMTRLTHLDVCEAAITDEGLKQICELSSLTSLALKGAKVTDTGVNEIHRLTQLRQLYLGDTQITDACLKAIASLPNLTDLELTGTSVTDDGLNELSRLKEPRILSLAGTQTTKSGIDRLKKTFPELHIER